MVKPNSTEASSRKDAALSHFEALLKKVTARPASKPKEATDTKTVIEPAPISDEEIMKMIAENPDMNASTFYNLIKSKGAQIIGIKAPEPETPKDTTEADSASVNAASIRADEGGQGSGRKPDHGDVEHPYGKVIVKDPPKHGPGKVIMKQSDFSTMSFKFIEAVKPTVTGVNGTPDNPIVGFTKFKVVMLQEGMGNFGTAFWYTKEAIQSAVPVFEGKKIYADHPSTSDEYNRPERTVRDILGHFENVHTEEGEDGRLNLVGEVKVLQDDAYRWARSLMEHAVEFSNKYPDKEFIGLSINADGDAAEMPINDLITQGVPESTLPKLQEAQAAGIDSIRVVSVITDAVSCDLVTEAGAGGKVLQLLEGDNMKKAALKEDDGQKDPSALKAEGDAPPAKKDPEQDPAHDDKDQDMELIKKMLAQHDMKDASEEECGMAKEAYEACKDMGHGDEDAMKQAVHHLKMMKHMASKKAEAEGESHKEDESEKHESHKEDEAHKEANVKLRAENAQLKESLKKIEVNSYIDAVCAKSGMPIATTKLFKESATKAKSIDEVKKLWALFETAYKQAGKDLGGYMGLTIQSEKVVEAVGQSSTFDGVFRD